MAESLAVKTKRNITLEIYDLTPTTPLSYMVDGWDGVISYEKGKDAPITVYDRGAISGSRKGQEPVGKLAFKVDMRQFTDGTEDTLIDVLEGEGNWAAMISTGGAAHEEIMHGVKVTAEGTDFGDSTDHDLDCAIVRLDWKFSSADLNVIEVTGDVYLAAVRSGPT